MKTWVGIWRRIGRCLPATNQPHRTSRRAIRCTVISVCCWISSFSSDLFALVTMCFSVEIPPSLFSCKWTYVREPSWTGHVCRGQSNVVHLWAGHRGGHPRCLFRGEHLQEAEHNAGHHQPVPSHHDYCRHAAKHSWFVILHSHTHTQTQCYHSKATPLSLKRIVRAHLYFQFCLQILCNMLR